MEKGNLTCYSCVDDNCEPLETTGVCKNAFACWQSSSFMPDGKQRNMRGCIKDRLGDRNMACRFSLDLIHKSLEHRCCIEDLCNSVPFRLLERRTPPVNPENNNRKLLATILGPLIGLILIICGITYIYYRKRTKRNRSMIPSNNCSREIRASACGDSTINDYLHDHNLTSGSGSGLPILAQRTLAQQVTLEECLSKGGGFGRQIWRGTLQGEHVAVKVFCTRDEAAWARETEVYNRLLSSSHENILGYIGSDVVGLTGITELWLVSHYHEPGSLYNYLGQLSQQLSHCQMFDVCLSVTNGLLYLHSVIEGTHKKLAMAHRNLCSKSIVVKANGTCAIADLAHVVTEDRLDADKLDLERVSKRYMSPELLEQTFDRQSLESFRRADMYSLGLVFWEVCRCCIDDEVAMGYAAPYSEWLVNGEQEPTLEEMRKLVVTDQRRPSISNCWDSDPTLVRMKALMEECWYTNAAARLPILRVKKTLGKIATNIPDIGSA